MLAEFFEHLHEVDKLAQSTLRGYKAAILSVLNLSKPLSDLIDRVLKSLFQSFEVDRPPAKQELPQWNIGIVLQGLKKPPFEPLSEASFRFLSMKTLFLTVLATGSRRGEILALIFKHDFRVKDSVREMLLYPDPGFLPKTRRGVSSNRPLVLPSLPCSEQEDSLLCPVRALENYFERTSDQDIRKGREKLFLPVAEASSADLTTHALKVLMFATIEEAYRAVGADIGDFKLRLHDMRRLSFSIASASGVSMNTILAAGRWSRPSVFTSFYLHSTARFANSLYAIGPIAVASSIVDPAQGPTTGF